VAWVQRGSRYVEKLATPDVTIADMLGDVDPIKAARGGYILADEMTIHYGLLPRANRGILGILKYYRSFGFFTLYFFKS
jgi:magnesium chelatase subunit I